MGSAEETAPSPGKSSKEVKATVPGYGPLGKMSGLHEHLLSSPDVRSLDLRATLMGCSEWPDRWNLPFRLTGEDAGAYPPLTSLRLEGYEFNQSDWNDALPERRDAWGYLNWANSYVLRRLWPLWRDVPVERREMTNLQLWLEAMDWSKLEDLALISGVEPHFAELATPHLVSLRSLEVRSGRRGTTHAAAGKLICELPAGADLVNLTWAGAWDPKALDPVLQRHGATLRRLEVYAKEPWRRNPEVAAVLTAAQIRAVGAGAPKLEHLTLTLDRNDGVWPWEVLEALATELPELASADIWLELAADCMRDKPQSPYMRRGEQEGESCSRGAEFREPRLTAASAAEVFAFLRAKNSAVGGGDGDGGGKLQRVTFYIGDWSRPWDGPLYIPGWLEYRRGKVECSVTDGGKEVCEHVVSEEGGIQWANEDFLVDPMHYEEVGGGVEAARVDEEIDEELRKLEAQMEL
ncbi:hypothetical protein BX600DRAFT_515851 [Xylariales sp. PMI_506]|nr:hypothetical protein BX600DRAFT_515851 [Xylariales sp. PMI_506]